MPGTMSKDVVDVVRILEICRDIELHFVELYRYYAEIFNDNAEISRLWYKTAMEEENHANQFVLAINLRKQGMIETVAVDLFSAENTLNFVKSVFDGVRHSKPTLVDALRSAIKLEDKLEEFHMNSIAVFTEEAHKKLFEAMMKADRMHLEKIKEAYQKAILCS